MSEHNNNHGEDVEDNDTNLDLKKVNTKNWREVMFPRDKVRAIIDEELGATNPRNPWFRD